MSDIAIKFSLNHMICPGLTAEQLIDAAAGLGVDAVELRNDVQENSVTELQRATAIGEYARARGIKVLSINALYPFNVWNDEMAVKAEKQAQLANAAGAIGLVMCPFNENGPVASVDDIKKALTGLQPILEKHGLQGFVEALGFPFSSMRTKRVAVDAIEGLKAQGRFGLVHDTFHHKGAAEQEMFPALTGLVHISGVEDPAISFNDMLDAHRVLVGPQDRLDNIGQIKQLLATGYTGYFSFEPFSAEVWDLPDPIAAVKDSMDYIRARLAE
ncbi:TIM barrel protein [Pokkaliibacter plantistimulans]|uniref:TIM barrel protein n=1 Tax=Pokkaliibacter plantistimulans TaxID=1635171 RepID=UPI002693DCD4|nr:TIM barrel protein [Pokkaliibacter plantistimulans]